MSHPPRTGVFQGNFAASVKRILPIHEWVPLRSWPLLSGIPTKSPRICDIGSLTSCLNVA
jgi:hypothetical protein